MVFKKHGGTILFLAIILIFVACGQTYTPKPRGHFRIDLPEKHYVVFDSVFPYSFEIPVYGALKPDTHPSAQPFWSNLVFGQFSAQVHLSYLPIKSKTHIVELAEDARTFVLKHIPKATAIYDEPFSYPRSRVHGMFFEIKGREAASTIQFFATDSLYHFLRGALYFNVAPNNDSLAPVIEFLQHDIRHMINTLNWKN